MSESIELPPELRPDPEVLKEVATIPVVPGVMAQEPLTKEQKQAFMEELMSFADWWQLPLPKWCYDCAPLDNPMSIKMFMWDAEHYSRIKAGDETMPEEEFAKFEKAYLARLDEFRKLRREKHPLASPEVFKMVADHQGS